MDAEGKFFSVRSRLNGFALDVSDCQAAPNVPVCVFPFTGGDNQLWYEDSMNSVIRSKLHDDYVLQINGGQLVVNVFHPDEYNQKLVVAGDRVCTRDNQNRVLDVAQSKQDPGASVCAWDYNGGNNQKWDILYQPPAFCYIMSKMHGKVIDVKRGDMDPGTKIVMYKKWDDVRDNQLFWEDKYGYIRSKLTGFAIDTTEGSARMQPYDPNVPGMQWIKFGDFIVNKMDPTKVLDIKGEDDDNGAKLCAYENNGGQNQRWTFAFV